uniref:Si:dkey-191g9.7 n=1 Tax=Neogobius melanostomus TaxID=47308 RepID=A0A8C6T9V5_9GOBI
MADNSTTESQGRAYGAEGCLSQAPPELNSVCESLHQNCCTTKEKPPEEGRGEPETQSPSDDAPCCRTDQCLRETSLPVTRSPSLCLPKGHTGGDTSPLVSDSGKPAPVMCTLVQSSDGSAQSPLLVCKRPMQLQQCNMVTTVCRGPLCSDGTASQLFQGPEIAVTEESLCDSVQCYASHFHPPNLEDTFAAYCHPQPIPAPSQILPSLTGPEGPIHLNLPHLMSSLSDTGLDAKHLSCCCQLGYSWTSALPQPQIACELITRTCDVGTLTISSSQRDVAVQTEGSNCHVFPQVCLSEEICQESKKTSQDPAQKAGSKSPVKEVKWDAEGMTWEVYGASVDPEELGVAIQKHLELQIKETASRAAKLSRQNTNTSRQSVSCQRRKRILSSLRPPACCVRTTTAVD